MDQMHGLVNAQIPRHWIGVEKSWSDSSTEPWPRLVALPPNDLKTHALILGSTGSGKTNLLHHMIAQDVLLGNSFAVLDLRGDLVTAAINLCAGRVDPRLTRIIDLRKNGYKSGFDPLHGSGETYFRALGVLQAVEAESDSWGVQLSETLRNALLLLAEADEPITRLDQLFFDRPFLLRCLESCMAEAVLGFWQRYDALSAEKQATLAMPVLNKLSLLTSTVSLRRVLARRDPVELRQHIDTRGSVTLVSLAVDEVHGAGRMFGNIFLASLAREVFSRIDIPEQRRNQIQLYIDEFEHFGGEVIENILAEGRKYGLSLILAHQTLAQLDTRMRSLILNNVGTKIVFRTGREDGSVLSRDLTGDPKAIDFNRLPVGECVLWRRQHDLVSVEVNRPLFVNSGELLKHGKAYIRAIADYRHDIEVEMPVRDRVCPRPPKKTATRQSPEKPLEGWL